MNRSLKELVCLSFFFFFFFPFCQILVFEVSVFRFPWNFFLFVIFEELAKLDKTERRYAWIKRRIRTNEEIWKIFPASWHVPYRLCIQFCKKTRYNLLPFSFCLNQLQLFSFCRRVDPLNIGFFY